MVLVKKYPLLAADDAEEAADVPIPKFRQPSMALTEDNEVPDQYINVRVTPLMVANGELGPFLITARDKTLPKEVLLEFEIAEGRIAPESVHVWVTATGHLTAPQFTIYLNTIVLPWVEKQRRKWGEVYQDQPFVLWLDGETAQIKAALGDELIRRMEQSKVVLAKSNPKRSGLEQGCDVASCFRSLKKVVQSRGNIQTDRHPAIACLWDDVESKVKALKKPNRRALAKSLQEPLIKFLVSLRSLVQQCFQSRSIINAFERTGQYPPSLEQALQQRRGPPVTAAVKGTLEKWLPKLAIDVTEEGRVRRSNMELVYEELEPSMDEQEKKGWQNYFSRTAELANYVDQQEAQVLTAKNLYERRKVAERARMEAEQAEKKQKEAEQKKKEADQKKKADQIANKKQKAEEAKRAKEEYLKSFEERQRIIRLGSPRSVKSKYKEKDQCLHCKISYARLQSLKKNETWKGCDSCGLYMCAFCCDAKVQYSAKTLTQEHRLCCVNKEKSKNKK